MLISPGARIGRACAGVTLYPRICWRGRTCLSRSTTGITPSTVIHKQPAVDCDVRPVSERLLVSTDCQPWPAIFSGSITLDEQGDPLVFYSVPCQIWINGAVPSNRTDPLLIVWKKLGPIFNASESITEGSGDDGKGTDWGTTFRDPTTVSSAANLPLLVVVLSSWLFGLCRGPTSRSTNNTR